MRATEHPEIVLSARRVLPALGVGFLAGAGVALAGEALLAPVTAWVVAALVGVARTWLLIWPLDAGATEQLAECEGRSRTTDAAILVAAAVSLGAVVLALMRSGQTNGAEATAAVLLCVVSVILSWALVNTVFALKYARLYYVDEDGGLDFENDQPPAYSDFAYVAFTVGMTFATPDTRPTHHTVRTVMLGHALLSYAFGTGVLAVAINLVTNLAQ